MNWFLPQTPWPFFNFLAILLLIVWTIIKPILEAKMHQKRRIDLGLGEKGVNGFEGLELRIKEVEEKALAEAEKAISVAVTVERRMVELEELVEDKFFKNCPICLEHAAISGGKRAADAAQEVIFRQSRETNEGMKDLTQKVAQLTEKVNNFVEGFDTLARLMGKTLNLKTGKLS
jgi:hypothetical protein